MGQDDDITATQKMFSAMSGSFLTSLLMTPLDVVRVRWQSQPVPTGNSTCFSPIILTTKSLNTMPSTNIGVTACCREVFFMNNNAEYCVAMPPRSGAAANMPAAECAVEEIERRTISSTMDGLRKIARNEGLTSLWRGLSPTLVMAVPANIIYFTGYDWLRYNSKSPISHRFGADLAPLIAGSVARVLAAAAVSPIELFRTRLQATTGSSTTGHLANTFREIQEMVHAHGYKSLWRGLTLTLWRDVPFSGIYWWGYETVRRRLIVMRESDAGLLHNAEGRDKHTETFVDSFIAGAVSGSIASIITMPFDVGKTRTQVFRGISATGNGASSTTAERGNMTRLLWHIFHTEGIRGLWKGWIPRTLKVAPACAIMISSYEVGKKAFRSINAKARENHGH
ncbi:solute carrier family 25 member 40 [Sodiomyces alkalinus F11]|uniref:Solute carrier family 25 member 40 n=1 Tax=Sodiomyces alkalinus (strain CBS 110278 / VKM F-3762 / F11) TaxID=1314773 RepID=A0A3N2Q6F3_SODAK|nr:solute carrier family 25 member 40 [Sodiomyces alkalinus F11]ROT42320.1 solute carrier family 25 member 40 [Sodiomyces alkalinus F11]